MKNYFIYETIFSVCFLFVFLIPVRAAEPDNTAGEAGIILLNDETPRHYYFENPEDEDWVKFYGIAGQTYEIEVTNVGSDCDVVIQLYDTDGMTSLEKADDNLNGEDESLKKWVCPENGIYYVKFYNNLSGGEKTDYEVRIFNPDAASVPGIISGAVKNCLGQPIKDAIVITREPTTDTDIRTGISNTEGAYQILLHPAGKWEITAKACGYRLVSPLSFTIELPNPNQIINFTLYSLGGDIDADGTTDLTDAILALQIMTGLYFGNLCLTGEVNQDGKIGAEEAIFILQIVSNLRD